MIDPLGAAFAALVTPSPAAFGLVFLAGTVTSVGPCVAPRYLAISAFAASERGPNVPALVFIAGVIAACMALGFGSGWLGSIWRYSSLMYGLMSAGLLVGGCIAIVRAVPTCSHEHVAIPSERTARRPLGAIFLLGAASAFVISPCCTPVIAAIASTSVAIGNPLLGVGLLASFAFGHALPLLFAGSLATITRRIVCGSNRGQAAAVVAGALTLALGAYYGLLA